jgi:O-glycosyl hydrolase
MHWMRRVPRCPLWSSLLVLGCNGVLGDPPRARLASADGDPSAAAADGAPGGGDPGTADGDPSTSGGDDSPGTGDGDLIVGPAAGLFSETCPWPSGTGTEPLILFYFQSGSDAGVKIYTGTDYNPSGENIWYNRQHTGDAVEGNTSIWYHRPPLGVDSPVLDAHNASSRLLWKTFTTAFDVSQFHYFNVWIKPLDGFTGHLGLLLGSWNPADGGSSGDDGVSQSLLFPQLISGSDWQCLSIALSEYTNIDLTHCAKYVLQFDDGADNRHFLFDNITFSTNRPPSAGPPDPTLYDLTEPGEDPTVAADTVVITVNEAAKHQTIRGFGLFGDTNQKDVMVTNMGTSILRIEIPVSDPPDGQTATRQNTPGWEPVNDDADAQSFTANAGGSWSNFRTVEAAAQVAFMQEYRALYPDIGFFACAWSPPGWMKNSGRVFEGSDVGDFGNSIRSDSLGEYGEYLASYALYMHDKGVPLAGLSMGNEVHFNHDFASMHLVGTDMITAIKETDQRLAQAVSTISGFVRPKLTTDDHVLSQHFFDTGFAPLLDDLQADAAAGAAIDVISYHNYGVDAQLPENISNTVLVQLRSRVDSKMGADTELWMTETSGFNNSLLDGDRAGALTMGEGIYTSLAYANTTVWTFFGAEGLLYYGNLSWPGTILKHYARFIRPGAVRFDAAATTLPDKVLVLGFRNAASSDIGDSYVFVLINKDPTAHGLDLTALPSLGANRQYREYRSSIHHACEDMGAIDPDQRYVLPPQSVVTLVLR